MKNGLAQSKGPGAGGAQHKKMPPFKRFHHGNACLAKIPSRRKLVEETCRPCRHMRASSFFKIIFKLHIGLTATLPGTHSEKASDPFSLVVGASSSAPRLGETRRLPPPVLHFQPVGERLQGDNVLTSASPGPWQVHGQFLRLDFSQVAAGFEVETILEHCCIFDR